MESREIIRRVIEFNKPERIGFDLFLEEGSDLFCNWAHQNLLLANNAMAPKPWGRYEELLAEVPGFKGEVSRDVFGNIWGRLEKIQRGKL
jgi:hypothetical protein